MRPTEGLFELEKSESSLVFSTLENVQLAVKAKSGLKKNLGATWCLPGVRRVVLYFVRLATA